MYKFIVKIIMITIIIDRRVSFYYLLILDKLLINWSLIGRYKIS